MTSSNSIDGHLFHIYDTLLTPEECKHFIELLDKSDELKLVDSGLAYYYRNIWINEDFANEILNRIRHLLPNELSSSVSINPWFRFSKYPEFGEFKLHSDGVNQDAQGRRAIFTINIFLNDEFEGGETEFYNANLEFVHRACPKPGRAAIFYNQIPHKGNTVKGGFKYLLRTDVMI